MRGYIHMCVHPCVAVCCASLGCNKGWPEPYIYTVYDRIFADFRCIYRNSPIIRSYMVYIWFWPTLIIWLVISSQVSSKAPKNCVTRALPFLFCLVAAICFAHTFCIDCQLSSKSPLQKCCRKNLQKCLGRAPAKML